jgi:hypothetical protein
MQEIANGTHNYQLLNEIMPLIYKRFTDKTAEEWRQIYKVRCIDFCDTTCAGLTFTVPATSRISHQERL